MVNPFNFHFEGMKKNVFLYCLMVTVKRAY